MFPRTCKIVDMFPHTTILPKIANTSMLSTHNIGGYFSGYRSYIVELSEELKAYTKFWEDEEPLLLLDDDNEEPFTKNTFIAALKELHIGEWRRRYSTKASDTWYLMEHSGS